MAETQSIGINGKTMINPIRSVSSAASTLIHHILNTDTNNGTTQNKLRCCFPLIMTPLNNAVERISNAPT